MLYLQASWANIDVAVGLSNPELALRDLFIQIGRLTDDVLQDVELLVHDGTDVYDEFGWVQAASLSRPTVAPILKRWLTRCLKPGSFYG